MHDTINHMKSQKALSWLLLYISLIFFSVSFLGLKSTYAEISTETNEPKNYSKSDQHALVAPGVVRVAMSVKGTIKIQPFTINLDTLLAETLTDEVVFVEEVDTTFTGTAFSVSESGIYATNAHVVSTDYIRVQYAIQSLFAAIFNDTEEFIAKYGTETPEAEARLKRLDELEKLDDDDPVFEELMRSVLTYVTYEDEDTKLSLFPQDVVIDSIDNLHDFGSEILNAQPFDEWYMAGKDVALAYVHSDSASPALLLLDEYGSTTINTPVAAYGFPGSTDLSINTFSDVTVTQGTITSIKQPRNDGPEALQTDAKISKGSSGGPLVDGEGRVLGVMTTETGTETGDNFGFALPATLIHELLDEVGFIELDTSYSNLVRKGLAYKEEKRCELANDKFTEAINLKENWGVAKKEVQVLINECNAIIASGDSIHEVPNNEFKNYTEGINLLTWAFLIGGAFLIVLSTVLFMLLLRKNKSKNIPSPNIQQKTMSPPVAETPLPSSDSEMQAQEQSQQYSMKVPPPARQQKKKPEVSHEDYIENRFSSKKTSQTTEEAMLTQANQQESSPSTTDSTKTKSGFTSRSPGNEWNIGLTSVTPSDEEEIT